MLRTPDLREDKDMEDLRWKAVKAICSPDPSIRQQYALELFNYDIYKGFVEDEKKV